MKFHGLTHQPLFRRRSRQATLYNHNDQMRSHQMKCLEKGVAEPFPATKGGARCLRSIHIMGVYCHCRMPDGNTKMVQCVACREWFHQHCETVPQAVWKRHCQVAMQCIIHILSCMTSLWSLRTCTCELIACSFPSFLCLHHYVLLVQLCAYVAFAASSRYVTTWTSVSNLM